MSAIQTYKDNASLYNKVEDIPGEKAMLVECARLMRRFAIGAGRKIDVLDLCCGTELIFDHLDNELKGLIGSWVGVDISQPYLDDARARIGDDERFTFIKGDAAVYSSDLRFDIMIASSAYHHIEDERKLQFLRTVKRHLRENGLAIFLENIIPAYHDEAERKTAAVEFYTRRIIDCIDNHGITDERIPLLSRVMQYERDREYEWKSHYRLFLEHLKGSGLKVISEKKVWPEKGIFRTQDVGDFVFAVKKLASKVVTLVSTHNGELGIRQISSYLKARGFETRLAFAPLFGNNVYNEEELAGLKRLTEGSRAVCISGNSSSKDRTLQLIKALKNIPIIVGGPGPTLEPEVYLNSGAGEVYRGAFGEGAVHDILTGNSASNETMPRDILNAIPPPDYDFRGGGHFRLTQEGLIPIDTAEKSIPFIRNLGTIQDEKFGNRTCDGLTLTVISQRGCASFCDYCNNSTLKKIHGGSFRRERSIELVIEEICSAQDIHNGKISYVMIFDDDFFLRTMKDMRTFNRLWKAHVRLPFFVFGTPSAFSEEKLELLAGAGLNRLGLGFQSGSRSLCTKLGRRFTSLDKARDIIASLGRVQERYSGFTYPDIDFMIGTPAETAEEALDTLKWMLDLSLQGPYEAHCHVTTYYPGSVAYSRWAPILDPSSARYFMDLHDQRRVFDRCMKIIRASGDAEIVRHSYYTALMITAAGVQNKDNLGMFIRDELENKFALDLQDIKADTAHLTELYQKSDQYNQFAAITGKRHVF